MTATHDKVEDRLRELFAEQASALTPGDRVWDDDPPCATVTHLAERRSRKHRIGSGLAALTAAGVAAAVLFAFGVTGSESVKTEPPIGSFSEAPGGSSVTNPAPIERVSEPNTLSTVACEGAVTTLVDRDSVEKQLLDAVAAYRTKHGATSQPTQADLTAAGTVDIDFPAFELEYTPAGGVNVVRIDGCVLSSDGEPAP